LAHAKAFKLRQIPQRNIVGNNFALVSRNHALNSSSGQASGSGAESSVLGGVTDQTKPTHVVTSMASVYEQAGGVGVEVQQLAPGTLLWGVKNEAAGL
jgi:hypothetical protein